MPSMEHLYQFVWNGRWGFTREYAVDEQCGKCPPLAPGEVRYDHWHFYIWPFVCRHPEGVRCLNFGLFEIRRFNIQGS